MVQPVAYPHNNPLHILKINDELPCLAALDTYADSISMTVQPAAFWMVRY